MRQHSPKPAQRRGASPGFSMIEVLVAVALLAVILLALMGLISAGVQRAYSGKKMTEATLLAQSAMERANVYAAHTLLGAVGTDASATRTWTRTTTGTTPAAVTGTTASALEQIAWRTLLEQADLPATTQHPATLTVTMTAVPDTVAAGGPSTFNNAAMVRVVVDLRWVEWGTRQRQVRLQALNLSSTP